MTGASNNTWTGGFYTPGDLWCVCVQPKAYATGSVVFQIDGQRQVSSAVLGGGPSVFEKWEGSKYDYYYLRN